MEVCTTLGMLTPEQARQLREAGLSAYNHNLDTSPEYYGKITTSRKYEVSSQSEQRQSAPTCTLRGGLRQLPNASVGSCGSLGALGL